MTGWRGCRGWGPLRAALLAYALPVVGVLLGAAAGTAVAPVGGSVDLSAGIGAVAGAGWRFCWPGAICLDAGCGPAAAGVVARRRRCADDERQSVSSIGCLSGWWWLPCYSPAVLRWPEFRPILPIWPSARGRRW